MSSLDKDLTKKNVITNDGTSIQGSSANVIGSVGNYSAEKIQISFTDLNPKDAAKTLGLTESEYLKLQNNPEFAALKTAEEKLAFIKNSSKAAQLKTVSSNIKATETVGTETSISKKAEMPEYEAVSVKNATLTDLPKTETLKLAETKPEVDKQNSVTKDTSANDYCYDFKKYSEMEPRAMFAAYTEEYAKNKFLYGSAGGTKTPDAWNKLSDKERNTLIQEAKKEVKKEIKESKEIFAMAGKLKNATDEVTLRNKQLLISRMSQLQAASSIGDDISAFKKQNSDYQLEAIMENLNTIRQIKPDNLSAGQQGMLSMADTVLKSVKKAATEKGADVSGISYGSIKSSVEKYDIKLGVAIKDYLLSKEKSGNITKIEQEQLKILRDKVSPEYLESFGTRYGETTKAELCLSDSDYSEKFAGASTSMERAVIVAKHIGEEFKDQPDKIVELMKDANECGSFETVIALRNLAKGNKALAKLLAQEKGDILNYNVNGMETLGEYAGVVAANVKELENKDLKKAELYATAMINTSANEQLNAVTAVTAGMKSQKVQQATVDKGYDVEDEKVQRQILNNVKTKSSEQTKTYAAVESYRALESVQNDALHMFTDDSASATKAVIESGNLKKFSKANQTEAFKTLQTNAENLMAKDEAVKNLNALADQISQCDKSNQLDMHKSIMGSKYEEVQTHAAANIHTYDKSVQADAIKETYKSGNTKAIDACNSQLDKCDKAAIQSISKEIAVQIKAMEARHSESVSGRVAELTGLMALAKDPAAASKSSEEERKLKIAEYKELFMSASPAEKFKMISKLQGVWQKEIIAHIATYCPELFSSLVSSMGVDLFQLNLGHDVKNQIMKEMIRVPDMQGQALKYFKENPNNFRDSVKDACAELLIDREDASLETGEMQQALRTQLNYVSAPSEFSGGKISNREYYGARENYTTFWKRGVDGSFIS